ncbi:MAG: hypothetical protein IJ741_07095 [Schwartzia sp.]|nr:hypothetical protein [Schwartzia sp. (in: firmicutes)]
MTKNEYIAYFTVDGDGEHVVVNEMTEKERGKSLFYAQGETPEDAVKRLEEKCNRQERAMLKDAKKYNELAKLANSFLRTKEG